MRRVIIESPYAGNVERNLRYLRACLRDSLRRGEAPFASHGLYTLPGVLVDEIAEERALGIAAGFAWRTAAEATVVYEDLGITAGMRQGILHANATPRPVECRRLGADWGSPLAGLSDDPPTDKHWDVSPRLDRVLEELPNTVSVRVRNILLNRGANTITKATALTRNDLRRTKHCGPMSIHAIERAFAAFDLELARG